MTLELPPLSPAGQPLSPQSYITIAHPQSQHMLSSDPLPCSWSFFLLSCLSALALSLHLYSIYVIDNARDTGSTSLWIINNTGHSHTNIAIYGPVFPTWLNISHHFGFSLFWTVSLRIYLFRTFNWHCTDTDAILGASEPLLCGVVWCGVE